MCFRYRDPVNCTIWDTQAMKLRDSVPRGMVAFHRHELEPPDLVPCERPAQNGAYTGSLKVRHLANGVSGDESDNGLDWRKWQQLTQSKRVQRLNTMKPKHVWEMGTACPRGHMLTPENYRPQDAYRKYCMQCNRESRKRYAIMHPDKIREKNRRRRKR